MDRLENTLCYLCGAMDRVPDGGVGWRVHISKKLQEMGIGVLNPCDKPTSFAKEDAFFRDRIERFKKSNNFESVKSEMRDIAAIDLRMVDIAHFVIMDIDIDVHMCGSYHEAFVAVAQKKPLLIMCQQGKQNVPNWLFGVVPHEHMFGSWSELIEYIHHINEDEEVEDLNRWRFFDWEKVYG
jgi:hypothetical protein